MGKPIFVNYRRDDEGGFADSIHVRLEKEFGPAEVFRDQDGIDAGADFTRVIRDQVAACDVMLAVIGPKWLNMPGRDGGRRIDAPGDFVRIEIETGLQLDKRVIPVLVNKAKMPAEAALPPPIRNLALCNAVTISNDKVGHDCDALFKEIRKALAEARDRHGKMAVRNEWQKVLDGGDPMKMRSHLQALPTDHWLLAEAAPAYHAALAAYAKRILASGHLSQLKAFADEFTDAKDRDHIVRAIAAHPEEIAWLNAKDADTVAAVKSYLAKFPGGCYSDKARALLKSLQDRTRWEAARDSKDPIKLKEIAADPNSAYAGLARQMLDPNLGRRWKIIGIAAALLIGWLLLPDDFKANVVRALTGSSDTTVVTPKQENPPGGNSTGGGVQGSAPANPAEVGRDWKPMMPPSNHIFCELLSPSACVLNSGCIYSVDTGQCKYR